MLRHTKHNFFCGRRRNTSRFLGLRDSPETAPFWVPRIRIEARPRCVYSASRQPHDPETSRSDHSCPAGAIQEPLTRLDSQFGRSKATTDGAPWLQLRTYSLNNAEEAFSQERKNDHRLLSMIFLRNFVGNYDNLSDKRNIPKRLQSKPIKSKYYKASQPAKREAYHANCLLVIY